MSLNSKAAKKEAKNQEWLWGKLQITTENLSL